MTPWRLGSHYKIHVYEVDRPVATFHRAEDAEAAVWDHNEKCKTKVRCVNAVTCEERLKEGEVYTLVKLDRGWITLEEVSGFWAASRFESVL